MNCSTEQLIGNRIARSAREACVARHSEQYSSQDYELMHAKAGRTMKLRPLVLPSPIQKHVASNPELEENTAHMRQPKHRQTVMISTATPAGLTGVYQSV